MALPLAFAACTSEEIIENAQDQNLDARKALGNVELVFGDGAESRMTAEAGKIGFVAGDGVGACLVDVYSPTGKETDPVHANYLMSDYIQTNYQYLYDGSSWTTTARMVEGNYVFYAPYNGKHLSRKPITTGVPAVQDLLLNEDGEIDQYSILDAFVKSGQPAYVGYKFLEGGENQPLKVSVDMKPIFAYPLITIANDKKTDAADMVITKVVITGANFATEAPLTIGMSGKVAAKGDGIVGKLYNIGTKTDKNPFGAWAANTKEMLGNKTADVVGTAKEVTGAITINMPDGAYTIPVGESVQFHAVLPAASYAGCKAYAYTVDGMAYQLNLNAGLSAGKIYADAQYSATTGKLMSTATAANAFKVKSTLSMDVAPTIVSTKGELIQLLQSAIDNVPAITLANSDVKIDAEVIAAANASLLYSFNTSVDVVGGTAAAPLSISGFNFDNGVNIESGVVTLNTATEDLNVTVEAGELTLVQADNATVTVETGAKATIGNGSTTAFVGTVASLVNKGEVVIAKNVAASNITEIANTYVVSDVKKNAKITQKAAWLPLQIKGEWINDAETEITYARIHIGSKLTNNNSLTVKNALYVDGTLDNLANKMIIVDGTLDINGSNITPANATQYGSPATAIEYCGILEARGLFRGTISAAKGGRINMYNGYKTVTPFSAGSGILADVRESFNNTKLGTSATTNVDVPATGANMLSVKNLTLGSELPTIANIELQAGASVDASTAIAKAKCNTEITTLGDATISGLFGIDKDTYTLNITVAEGKTITFSAVTMNITKLMGTLNADDEITSKYKLTSSAQINGTIDNDATTGTIKLAE